MPDLTGQFIGRYHITERLGEGGMAVVKAYDTRLERGVALKIILLEAFSPRIVERMLKRFEREAKSLARLDHPHIIPVHDFGEHDGSPYLVMKYIQGGTLKARSGQPMPFAQAARLLLPVADALEYAHQQGIIHRDVKPANILMTQSGAAMLSDFGVAKILEGDEGSTLTGDGVGVGTPEYMAPEQWENKISPQTDVYALGVVFYELVTGRKPYCADTPAAVHRMQLKEALPRPTDLVSGLPEAVERVLFKALALEPEARYASMAEFGVALARLGDENSVPVETARLAKVAAPPPQPARERTYDELTPPAALRRMPGWGWRLAGVVGLGLIGLLAAAVFALRAIFGTTQPEMPTAQLVSGVTETVQVSATAMASATEERTLTPADTNTPEPLPTPALGIGSAQVSEKDGMVLVYVPEGNFEMGSNEGGSDEKPVHTVWLDAYWIDQTEVTNGMYAKCVAEGSCQSSSLAYNSDLTGSSQPVVGVDWNDASAYCAWAGRRLPTEAEWEKAGRGMDGRTYPWGNETPGSNLLNMSGNGDGFQYTAPVGSYPDGASPYGALDMAGNVWEWVADWYDASYFGSSPERNPKGPDSGSSRVLRGGSWDINVDFVRSANRYLDAPGFGNFAYGGFRCAVRAAP